MLAHERSSFRVGGRLHSTQRRKVAVKQTKPRTLSPQLDEGERQINDDYEWCLRDPEVRKKYAGRAVVAHRRKIWGAGKDYVAAWAAASCKRGCPSREAVAIVVVPDALAPTQAE